MIRLVGDVVHDPAHGVASVQRALRTAEHLDALDVVQAAFRYSNAEVRRVDPVIVGADTRIAAEATKIAANAADFDVPVRPGCRRDEIDDLVRALNAHIGEEVPTHRGNGNGCVGDRGFGSFAIDYDFFDSSLTVPFFGISRYVDGNGKKQTEKRAGKPAD